jgi:hypothetical protein
MSGGRHCYPDSDVLVNKYNIRDKELLEKFEVQKVATKLLGLDVRDSLVMANYDQKEYLHKIISDALMDLCTTKEYRNSEENNAEKYQIAKSDYEAFREKYSIKKN